MTWQTLQRRVRKLERMRLQEKGPAAFFFRGTETEQELAAARKAMDEAHAEGRPVVSISFNLRRPDTGPAPVSQAHQGGRE